MYKKQVLASAHQIDIDTKGVSAIPEMQKMHSINVIFPSIIETKEDFYSDIHMQHTFKLLENSHGDSHNQTQVMSKTSLIKI